MSHRIVRLESEHVLESFASRDRILNDWLRNQALQAQRSDTAITYVAVDNETDRITGYVSLASGSVMPTDMSSRIRKGTARDLPVPVLLLARLAVHMENEGRGIGGSLMLHAMRVTAELARQVGVRALIVNPIDGEAERFYRNHGFEPISGTVPTTLNMLTKDIRARIARVDAALRKMPPSVMKH